jgi:hypothetical protein
MLRNENFTIFINHISLSQAFSALYSGRRSSFPSASNGKYCHILGVCVTCKMGFEFYDQICYTFIQLVITFHRSLSLDWTLPSSDHTTLIHCSWSQSHSLLYSLGLMSQKTHPLPINGHLTIVMYCCKHYLATGCLPRIFSTGTCLSSYCIAVDLYVTVLSPIKSATCLIVYLQIY